MTATARLGADWPAPPGVVAFTTLRRGAGTSAPPFDDFNLGARCGDAAGSVAANRRTLVERFGLPSEPAWLRQVHGTTVRRVSTPLPGEEPEADAAVTSEPGAVLAILTADCLPVVLAAARGGEVAVAHAGWRGLAGGVLEATVDAMQAPPGLLVAWRGPAAGPADYEVGEDVRDAFVARDPGAAAAFVATRPGHWLVDLYALARRRLAGAGLDPPSIHGGGLSTIAEADRFFSHRRDRRTGRMATLAWIDQARASAPR